MTKKQHMGLLMPPKELFFDLKQLIDETHRSMAVTVNTQLSMLYWRIGKRLKAEILNNERAEYGQTIVVTVSRQLMIEYGKGFSDKNLWKMIQFVEAFPEEQLMYSLVQQLSWSHFVRLLALDDPLKRDFYTELCRVERWSVRALRGRIDSMLYERTALSKKPESVAKAEIEALRKEGRFSPDLVFRDPYVLEFLNLQDSYLEKDLEDAIMREIEHFLLEMGGGFCFVGRQRRITVDHEDFYLDLLLFHRDLKRLIAIELKLGEFKPEYKGQMELYLRWLNKYDRKAGEEPPIGLILCTGKKHEQIELLELGLSGIHVAEYLTVLPPKEILKEKLHIAIHQAKCRLECDKE